MDKIRVMHCSSGSGTMSYGYSFIQVGGFKGETNDRVIREEPWDGDISKVDIILDCRDGKCKPITIDQLQQIVQKV